MFTSYTIAIIADERWMQNKFASTPLTIHMTAAITKITLFCRPYIFYHWYVNEYFASTRLFHSFMEAFGRTDFRQTLLPPKQNNKISNYAEPI